MILIFSHSNYLQFVDWRELSLKWFELELSIFQPCTIENNNHSAQGVYIYIYKTSLRELENLQQLYLTEVHIIPAS